MTGLPRMFSLRGKVALVTGGARNLGFNMAAALAAAGADVIVTSRALAAAQAAARQLQERPGHDALALALDHCDNGQVDAVFREASAWKGHLDVVVNNAGGGSGFSPGHIFERDPVEVEQMVRTNLTGVLHCCQAAGRIMGRQGRGKIINIASMAGLIGRDRRMYERHGMKGQPADYAAAKAGVIGLTRDLAAMLAPHGVHVNAISPGGFARDNLPEGFMREYGDRTPLGRMGREEEDLNGAVVFLASAASDYVTGQNLVVDGGFSLWH